MKVLEIKNLKKKFGEKVVLKDISLQIKEGEVVSIIGPSGSGKSTLLRCATFLEKMDAGELSYSEKNIIHSKHGRVIYPHSKELRKVCENFGLVFQDFNLFPHYSVLKNIVDAPISVEKRKKEEVYEEARALLKKVGLEDKENAYPSQLSGGQQQRIGIARALYKGCDILLFDEATSSLDEVCEDNEISIWGDYRK